MVVAPIVLMSCTTSSMTNTTTSSEGILAALSEGGRGIDRQVWVRIWIPLLSSSEWLVACQLALANPLNVTMTELPAHAACCR
jgi:hypothetical protein